VLTVEVRMNLNNLDLNLLVALDALLVERSVTRAADRLGLTQPTLSHSLGRLRRHFDDDLLYRCGNTYALTPLAQHLAGRTSLALDGVQRIFAAQNGADHSASSREFTFACSDYGATVVGPALTAALARSAPGVTVHFRFADPDPFVVSSERLRGVDGLLMPHGVVRALPHLDLFRDRWVCLAAADNAALGETLTLPDLAALPWVSTFGTPNQAAAVLRQLRQLGIEPKVQVVVHGLLTLPFFLENTDRICIVPERIAQLLSAHGGLRVLECPFDTAPLVAALWWHPDLERDAEHAWVRRICAAAMSCEQMTVAV
jgi:DNA-binding transcriptional LysR family regulator